MREESSQQKDASPSVRHVPTQRYRVIILLTILAVVSAVSLKFNQNRSHGRVDELSDLEQRARQHPDNADALLNWANALQKAGQRTQAIEVYSDAAHLAPNDARAYVGLGILALQENREDVALVNFREAVKCNPNDADVWSALAPLEVKAHDYPKAIDAYQHLTKLQPRNADTWRHLGALQTHSHRVAEGHEALLQAVTLNPEDAEAQNALGVNAMALSQLPEAKQAFEKALTKRPYDDEALTGLALATLQLDPSPNGLKLAEQHVRRALALRPTADAHLALGRIHLLRREYDKAIAEFNTTLRLDNGQTTAYVYLSQAYAASGKPELARKASADYQQATAKAAQTSVQAGKAGPAK